MNAIKTEPEIDFVSDNDDPNEEDCSPSLIGNFLKVDVIEFKEEPYDQSYNDVLDVKREEKEESITYPLLNSKHEEEACHAYAVKEEVLSEVDEDFTEKPIHSHCDDNASNKDHETCKKSIECYSVTKDAQILQEQMHELCDPEDKAIGKKHLKCEICSKDFSTLRSLNKHRYIHSEETPFKCDVCVLSDGITPESVISPLVPQNEEKNRKKRGLSLMERNMLQLNVNNVSVEPCDLGYNHESDIRCEENECHISSPLLKFEVGKEPCNIVAVKEEPIAEELEEDGGLTKGSSFSVAMTT
ncbi:uncharacterized protein [Periplaneta americana]|uniref:uncharacterized protein isoform X5 n=1 Tax=Periplaneta americana TaxID=6978 RepID=UPI0037E9BE3C